ncbi:uncharacterized protein [Eleutherodactylus coqui]|uniref:uncharacterized protein n=1 Tax=Eleutherodactylus coqui TaxID=57060 RepID=UPI0034623A59
MIREELQASMASLPQAQPGPSRVPKRPRQTESASSISGESLELLSEGELEDPPVPIEDEKKYYFSSNDIAHLIKAVRETMQIEEDNPPRTIQDEMFGGLRSRRKIMFPVNQTLQQVIIDEWQEPEKRITVPKEIRNRLAFATEDVRLYRETPKVDIQIAKVAKKTLLPFEDTSQLSDPMDKKIDGLMKKAWEATSLTIEANIASTSVARSMALWLNRLEASIKDRAPREELASCLPLLKMATAFLADASAETVRYGAKTGVLSNSARRALWLKTWAADITSKNKLCAIPFQGEYMFGPVLDKILEKVGDKSKTLPDRQPFRKPSFPKRMRQPPPEVKGKGKTGRWSYPKGGRGGNATPAPATTGNRDTPLGGIQRAVPLSDPLKRVHKRRCRLPEQTEHPSRRMGTESASLRPTNLPVGRTADRPVRHEEKFKVPGLLLAEPQRQSTRGRRPVPKLGHGPSLRLSSLPTDPPHHQENPNQPGVSHTSCPYVGQKALVSPAKSLGDPGSIPTTSRRRSSPPGPTNIPRGREIEASSMDAESMILRGKGLSHNVITTLTKSRKPITIAIYDRIWKKFTEFCKIEPGKIPGIDIPVILEFLQAGLEKGLSPRTLKVHTAALGSYLDFPLAEHRWVRRFLKGAERLRPFVRETFPTWDLNIVLTSFCQSPFEPLSQLSLRLLTLKVTLLVAITSARRIGELQALQCIEPYMVIQDDRITFKLDPAFLPKVVSKFHREQTITLPSFCQNPRNEKEREFHNLDVRRAVLAYLEATRSFRKNNNLFIQFQGPAKGKTATKSTIARWIKTAIQEAYKARGLDPPGKIRAHSTRSLSSSWAEKGQASAEQICKAATWSSIHTFTRHYRVNVQSDKDLSYGRKVLQAVVPP